MKKIKDSNPNGRTFDSFLKKSAENGLKYSDLQNMSPAEICQLIGKQSHAYNGIGGNFVEMSLDHCFGIDETVKAAGRKDVNRQANGIIPNMEIKTASGLVSNMGNGSQTKVLYIPVINWEFTTDGYLDMFSQVGYVMPIRVFKKLLKENDLIDQSGHIKAIYRVAKMSIDDCSGTHKKLFEAFNNALDNGEAEDMVDFIDRILDKLSNQ